MHSLHFHKVYYDGLSLSRHAILRTPQIRHKYVEVGGVGPTCGPLWVASLGQEESDEAPSVLHSGKIFHAAIAIEASQNGPLQATCGEVVTQPSPSAFVPHFLGPSVSKTREAQETPLSIVASAMETGDATGRNRQDFKQGLEADANRRPDAQIILGYRVLCPGLQLTLS